MFIVWGMKCLVVWVGGGDGQEGGRTVRQRITAGVGNGRVEPEGRSAHSGQGRVRSFKVVAGKECI